MNNKTKLIFGLVLVSIGGVVLYFGKETIPDFITGAFFGAGFGLLITNLYKNKIALD
ncbi:hypothetical protein [Aquimarina sp. 2201CG5-10]|uniref:hypothetical protein n=1 Tax=Aquimarina callyspongiae TaxID=3098150 RepID=UPI002AB5ADFF|nr:hypothetical protein [Aquimarina sp. 2201CG5-10]MDY8138763.1 hypothetical protein [Aquimarina sp. 2201CG5-10]